MVETWGLDGVGSLSFPPDRVGLDERLLGCENVAIRGRSERWAQPASRKGRGGTQGYGLPSGSWERSFLGTLECSWSFESGINHLAVRALTKKMFLEDFVTRRPASKTAFDVSVQER